MSLTIILGNLYSSRRHEGTREVVKAHIWAHFVSDEQLTHDGVEVANVRPMGWHCERGRGAVEPGWHLTVDFKRRNGVHVTTHHVYHSDPAFNGVILLRWTGEGGAVPWESRNPATPSPPSSPFTSLPRHHVTITATDVPIVAPPSRYRRRHDCRTGRVGGVPQRRQRHPHGRCGWDTMLSASERRHQETLRRGGKLSFSQCNPANRLPLPEYVNELSGLTHAQCASYLHATYKDHPQAMRLNGIASDQTSDRNERQTIPKSPCDASEPKPAFNVPNAVSPTSGKKICQTRSRFRGFASQIFKLLRRFSPPLSSYDGATSTYRLAVSIRGMRSPLSRTTPPDSTDFWAGGLIPDPYSVPPSAVVVTRPLGRHSLARQRAVAIPLALAGASQACCKRKVGQGGSGEPPPNRGSVATSGWSVSDSRRHTVCRHTVAILGHEAGHCLTDIVFDTANRMARLPEMTFIVIKTWEMVNASLTSDSQVWLACDRILQWTLTSNSKAEQWALLSNAEANNNGIRECWALGPTESFVQCVGDSTNLKNSDGHPARPHVTILGFEFRAPRTLPDGPGVVLHSAGALPQAYTSADTSTREDGVMPHI
ncbi:hypothetical protein EDB87DRAFT_1574928 [Lactarius vividus]|nr:hypothetical protein EDB87DRAFT_1574928 [Lactarius vividus]